MYTFHSQNLSSNLELRPEFRLRNLGSNQKLRNSYFQFWVDRILYWSSNCVRSYEFILELSNSCFNLKKFQLRAEFKLWDLRKEKGKFWVISDLEFKLWNIWCKWDNFEFQRRIEFEFKNWRKQKEKIKP